MNKKALAELGLSDREIAVYIALLKLGSTTTGPLVRESNVQNAKIYETLEKLMKKGFVSYIMKGKIKHFQPNNPIVLLNFFEEKKTTMKEVVDELQQIQNKVEPSYEARIYEGLKAIKSVFYEMYDYIGKNAGYCVFPIGEQLESDELVLFWSQVFQKQQKMKIRVKTMPNIKWRNIFEKYYKKYKYLTIKYTKKEFPTGVFIFKDHILNVVWSKKPVAFLIKSKENYLKWQKFFNEEWKIAKP